MVLSTQHCDSISHSDLVEAVREEIIKPVLPAEWINKDTKYFINPTGRFVIGGPMGDCGLTGRKIIVDTYGGMARHGGGAFSGKDPSKVDRSAAYAARYVAKNIVAAGLADRCEVQVSYAIGVAEPTDSAASAVSEWRPETTVSTTPKAITANWPTSTVAACRKMFFRSNKVRTSRRGDAAVEQEGFGAVRRAPYPGTVFPLLRIDRLPHRGRIGGIDHQPGAFGLGRGGTHRQLAMEL